MTLFKHATLVEFDPPRVREDHDLLVDGDAIVAVGANLSVQGLATVIDAGGKLIFPGLVCSHHHYYSGLARGMLVEIGPTPDFVSILKRLWWRMDRALDEESLHCAALVCSLDAIRCGTTAVIDHNASPNFITGSLATIQRAFEEAGLRGVTCYEVTDRHGEAGMREGVEENVAFAKRIDDERAAGTWSGLTEALIGGHAPATLPDDGLTMVADACEATGRGFHVHVAEDIYDASHSHITYGKDLIPRLMDFGLIDERSLIAHGTHLSSREVELLNGRDAFLLHSCRSNMNNDVGYNHRLPEFKHVALGTDGIGGDMFTELKSAYFKHRDAGGPLGPGDFLGALAAGNEILRRVFGRSFGRLEPGYAADLVVAYYASPTPLVAQNIAGHMVFGMGSEIVETVMIDGRIVMRDRRLAADIETIYRRARRQAVRLWERMKTIEA
ncbi:MAG: putative aminohydrolase SsnA [Spirochaetales bacterium]|nr:putative aminohydrolase SsnA [Spirochaetales bacterium]